MVISPWGEILDQLPTGEGIAIANSDPAEVERIRREMPIANHQRPL
jgi:nitrilase